MKRIKRIVVTFVCLLFFWPLYLLVIVLTFLFNVIHIRKLIALFHSKKTIRVVFWDAQPPTQSGNYFRVQKWADLINKSEENIKITNWYDFKDPLFKYLRDHHIERLIVYTFYAYWRFLLCFRAAFFNVVVMRREFLLYYDFGGLYMEKFLKSIAPHLIYDVDDKIHELKKEPRKLNWNTKYLQQQDGMKGTNMYGLFDYFFPLGPSMIEKIYEAQPNFPQKNFQKIPMCVDYKKENTKDYTVLKKPIVVGWYGAPKGLENLGLVVEALNKLAGKYDFVFCIICSVPLKAACKFPLEFREWSLETENENLLYFDIGVGPQYKSISEKRQGSSFKVTQYMGFGLVTAASNLSYNRALINPGENGFIVEDDEWEKTFEYLFTHQELFSGIGAKAYETVYEQHSYDKNFPRMVNFLKHVASEKVK